MLNKSHLSLEGVNKIVGLRASLNNGLPETLKEAFPNAPTNKIRPTVDNQVITDPYWLAGFASAEGTFMVRINKNPAYKVGAGVQIKFSLAQHTRDSYLLQSLIEYLNCGKYYPRTNRELGEFSVVNFSDMVEKILPFFQKYSIMGVKSKDFADLVLVAGIMEGGGHKTELGLQEILAIKERMSSKNKGLID